MTIFLCQSTFFIISLISFLQHNVDADAARKVEEEQMLADATRWASAGRIDESEDRHSQSGASSLHVAAAKGYGEVRH